MNRLGGLMVIAPARRVGDSGSIPGPGENFFLLNYFISKFFFFKSRGQAVWQGSYLIYLII